MVACHGLRLDERQHAISAAEPEKAYLKKSDEELKKYHIGNSNIKINILKPRATVFVLSHFSTLP